MLPTAVATKTFSFRAPVDKVEKIRALARTRQCDPELLLNEALDQYLELHEYHRELIEEGLRAVEAGNLVSHEEVVRRFAELKADVDRDLADVAAGRVKQFDAERIIARGKKLLTGRTL